MLDIVDAAMASVLKFHNDRILETVKFKDRLSTRAAPEDGEEAADDVEEDAPPSIRSSTRSLATAS